MSDVEKNRGLIGCKGHFNGECHLCFLTHEPIKGGSEKCYVDPDTFDNCQKVQEPLFSEFLSIPPQKGNHRQ